MLNREFVLPLLCLAYTMASAEAFVAPANFAAAKMNRNPSLTYKVRPVDDIVGNDSDGNVVRVPVKNIEREWEIDGQKAEGEISVDLFLPENQDIKGCAFFMHGFSQYPVAYYGMLKDACEAAGIAIIAVETGLGSEFDQALKEKKDGTEPQFVLQRAVSEDTKQCIRMLKEGDSAFADYGVTKAAVGDKIAVMGHSMGGGLSFPVAADEEIDYVFVMAPAYGVDAFDPIKEGTDLRAPEKSMLLAGGWDVLAPADKVLNISKEVNKKEKDSSVYVKVRRGLHTGFQDEIVFFNKRLSPILKGTSFFNFLFGIIDFWLLGILNAFSFVRTKTGQIDGSSILMSYFMSAMTEGKDVTPEDAEKYLDDNLTDKFEDKFEFSYGGK